MPGKGFIRDSVHKKKMLLENSFFVGALIFWYKSFFMIKMTKVWKFLPSRFSPGMISVSLKYEYENFEKCESFLLKMFTRDDFCIFKVWRWKFEKSMKLFLWRCSPGRFSVSSAHEDEKLEKCESFLFKMFTKGVVALSNYYMHTTPWALHRRIKMIIFSMGRYQ